MTHWYVIQRHRLQFFSSLFLHFNENVEITDVDFVLFNKSWPRAKRSSGSNSFCQLQIARSSRVLPYSNTFFLGPFACLLNLRRSVYNTVTVTTCPIQLNNRAPRWKSIFLPLFLFFPFKASFFGPSVVETVEIKKKKKNSKSNRQAFQRCPFNHLIFF